MNDQPTIDTATDKASGGGRVRRYGLPVAFLAGGLALGATLMPMGLANARATPTESETGCQGHHADRGGPRGPFGAVAVLEDLLGLTAEEIRTALSEGQTLAEVAEANGVSTEELVAALVARATERLDSALADGRMDADRAAEIAAGLESRITERVTTVHDHDGGGHHRGGWRGRGPDGGTASPPAGEESGAG